MITKQDKDCRKPPPLRKFGMESGCLCNRRQGK